MYVWLYISPEDQLAAWGWSTPCFHGPRDNGPGLSCACPTLGTRCLSHPSWAGPALDGGQWSKPLTGARGSYEWPKSREEACRVILVDEIHQTKLSTFQNMPCLTYLVLLQIPALHHLVEATGEHVGVSRTHHKTSDLRGNKLHDHITWVKAVDQDKFSQLNLLNWTTILINWIGRTCTPAQYAQWESVSIDRWPDPISWLCDPSDINTGYQHSQVTISVL